MTETTKHLEPLLSKMPGEPPAKQTENSVKKVPLLPEINQNKARIQIIEQLSESDVNEDKVQPAPSIDSCLDDDWSESDVGYAEQKKNLRKSNKHIRDMFVFGSGSGVFDVYRKEGKKK